MNRELTEDRYFEICDNLAECVLDAYEGSNCSNGVSVKVTPIIWDSEHVNDWAIDVTVEQGGHYASSRIMSRIFNEEKWDGIRMSLNQARMAIEERIVNG